MDVYNQISLVSPLPSVFGGFAGGYSQTPAEQFYSPAWNALDMGLGIPVNPSLPRVDPFNYPGQIPYGPAYTIIGPPPPQFQVGSGFGGPPGGPLMMPGFYPGF